MARSATARGRVAYRCSRRSSRVRLGWRLLLVVLRGPSLAGSLCGRSGRSAMAIPSLFLRPREAGLLAATTRRLALLGPALLPGLQMMAALLELLEHAVLRHGAGELADGALDADLANRDLQRLQLGAIAA